MLLARESVTREAVAARRGQKSSAVVIENSVALTSEAAAGVAPADVMSMQETGDVGSQRSTRGAGTPGEEKDEAGGRGAVFRWSGFPSSNRCCRRNSLLTGVWR